MATDPVAQFIARWKHSGAAERANYQLFLIELAEILGVPKPSPAQPDNTSNDYIFERSVEFLHDDGSTSGFIDLYKRGCFVLEAKQGSDLPNGEAPLSEAVAEAQRKLKKGTARRGTRAWDDAMLRARARAEQYVRALPVSEGRPPFLLVVDVGHSIEVFAEFSRTGGQYAPFPAPGSHRILLHQLEYEEIRERLARIWTAPDELDPARRSAKATREIAARLARLAVSLEKSGHDPHAVATFLMRCLFTMFAEDVGLLGAGVFTRLLDSLRDCPESFQPMVEEVWSRMNTGGFSTALCTAVLQFNGGLFEDSAALRLDRDQLLLLLEASRSDWRDVEPAIFGTLLERALDPVERHKLGAHYTPRAYVERLVLPTIVEPLRAQWDAVQTAAVYLANAGNLDKAIRQVKEFHKDLSNVRILDPACGTGNFLYVTLEHLKRIEGEIYDLLRRFGDTQAMFEMKGYAVDPHQLLGLEINPRAAAIAELVLWIGTLQWHFRTRGNVHPPQPIIRNFHNIEHRDALIEYDGTEPALDDEGRPVTRWDGRTTKPHPVTGREVPDENARVPVLRYINPRKAEWPEADYIVGNPPFVGAAQMRESLGDGYTEAVRRVHSDVPESCDFVMYWWNHAAELVRAGKVRRFGFVSTNSLRQKFNRRVLGRHLVNESDVTKSLCLLFAIPDHPWVTAEEGAAVRIAMTVGTQGKAAGLLVESISEHPASGGEYQVDFSSRVGLILPDLTMGVNLSGAVLLKANQDLSNRGFCLFGAGFIVTAEEAMALGLGSSPGLERHIRRYRNGRDLTATPRDFMVIDLYGLTDEQVRNEYPAVYQWVFERVKPERDHNNRESRRRNWWIFGEPNPKLRGMLADLPRYIATVETSKHRFFVFLDAEVTSDNKLVAIASSDAYELGVLSSRIHVTWALATGAHLGVGNDPVYVKTRCFETFAFPACTESQKQRIRNLGEQLDAHRKRQQAEHPELTLTGMYNVLEKLRSCETLTAKDKAIHEAGLVGVLKQIHDELDAAVADAYGWPVDLSDEEILERLVALNAERATEEARGLVRWLRPEYQNPEGATALAGLEASGPQAGGSETETTAAKGPTGKLPWPSSLPAQFQALGEALARQLAPVDPSALARQFEKKAKPERVAEMLETLVALGHARRLPDGRFLA